MTTAAAEKRVCEKNQIWYTEKGSQTEIGFTADFLNTVKEAWHVVPVSLKEKVKPTHPLLAVETNDALFTVFSPREGQITTFNSKAHNFPDQLTEDDVICVLDSAPQRAQEAPQAGIAGGLRFEPTQAQREIFARIAEQEERRALQRRGEFRAQAVNIPAPNFGPGDWRINPVGQAQPPQQAFFDEVVEEINNDDDEAEF